MVKLRFPKPEGMRRREAYDWLPKLQREGDPEIQRKFQIWYADPDNAAAFDDVSRNYGTSAVVRLSRPGEIENLAAARTPVAERLAVAATMAAVAVALFALAGRGPFSGTEAVLLATNVGEIRQVSLTDGSKITLDSATKVEVFVGSTARKARLKYGRARFIVAPLAEPFVIEAGKTSVRATKGVVDVEAADDGGRVDVLAGNAAVRTKSGDGAQDMKLQANQAVSISPARASQMAGPERDRNWPGGMIQFARTPIKDAVAAANHYSDQKILLGDGVGQLEVSGAFHVGDTQRLATVLADCFHLKLTQAPNGDFILSVNGQSVKK